MGEVVGLRSDLIDFTHGEPDEALIAALEEMLTDARSGSIRAIAYTAITSERGITTNWAGHADRHDMFAGVGMLQFRVLQNGDLENVNG